MVQQRPVAPEPPSPERSRMSARQAAHPGPRPPTNPGRACRQPINQRGAVIGAVPQMGFKKQVYPPPPQPTCWGGPRTPRRKRHAVARRSSMNTEQDGRNLRLVHDGPASVAVADLETTEQPTVIRASDGGRAPSGRRRGAARGPRGARPRRVSDTARARSHPPARRRRSPGAAPLPLPGRGGPVRPVPPAWPTPSLPPREQLPRRCVPPSAASGHPAMAGPSRLRHEPGRCLLRRVRDRRRHPP